MLISALLNTVAIAPMGKKSQESVAESTSIPVSLSSCGRDMTCGSQGWLNERFPQWEGVAKLKPCEVGGKTIGERRGEEIK